MSGERLVRRFPAMEASQVTGGYAALYAVTPDWHPIVDELGLGSSSYTCVGFRDHGFKLGPAVGLMAADMVKDSTTQTFDSHLLRVGHYAAGKPVGSLYTCSTVG